MTASSIHCPLCGAGIDSLYAFVKAERKYEVSLLNGIDGPELDWDEMDVYDDDLALTDFECPECQALLFHDADQVTKFMQWGDLYPWKGVDDYGQKSSENDKEA